MKPKKPKKNSAATSGEDGGNFRRLAVVAVAAAAAVVAVVLRSSWGSDSGDVEEVGVDNEKRGPVGEDVFRRGLLAASVGDLEPADVVLNHAAYYEDTSKKNFRSQHVLAYVTPWNNHGYDVAKTFGGSKISMVSPVWLQVVPAPPDVKAKAGGTPYLVTGLHDVDAGWIETVKKKKGVKVLPRVLFDGWTGQDYLALFRDPRRSQDLAKVLQEAVVDHDFDGLVLEVWSQLGGQAKAQLTEVIRLISRSLRAVSKTLVLVIPPPKGGGGSTSMFDDADLDNLANHVDFFSLMTYDFNTPGRSQGGPNAPLKWMRACVEKHLDPDGFHRQKILLGLNFYGYDYGEDGGVAVLGRDLVRLLKGASGPVRGMWDAKSAEHFWDMRVRTSESDDDPRRHLVYYPSLASIKARLDLASDLGLAGVAIWEIGQGLDYFYDLL